MPADYDEKAWVNWCEVNDLDPWPTDPHVADAQLADWLYLNFADRNLGWGRIKSLAQTVKGGFANRGLDDPRGMEVSLLRAAVVDAVGTRTEAKKIDPLTAEEIQSVVAAALLKSAAPTPTSARRALGIELGHTHQVPTTLLKNIRGEDLGERSVWVDGKELVVETNLDPLRSLELVFGPNGLIQPLYRPLVRRTGFEITLAPVIGAGLTDEQARWARFGANPKGVASLLWLAYLLTGNAFALRHADLARMDISYVVKRPAGIGFTVFGGKGFEDGEPRHYEVAHDHDQDRLCAACTLWSWTQWCRLGEGRSAGPLWVSRMGAHSDDNKAVSVQAAIGAINRAVQESELACRRLGTRSIRIGTSTEMAIAGASLAEIMEVTGHRSVSEAVRYIRLLSPRFQPHLDV